jgi:hypothetical protein
MKPIHEEGCILGSFVQSFRSHCFDAQLVFFNTAFALCACAFRPGASPVVYKPFLAVLMRRNPIISVLEQYE